MLLDSDIARQFMDIMNDRDLVETQRMDKLKELAADVREHQAELDGMDFKMIILSHQNIRLKAAAVITAMAGFDFIHSPVCTLSFFH